MRRESEVDVVGMEMGERRGKNWAADRGKERERETDGKESARGDISTEGWMLDEGKEGLMCKMRVTVQQRKKETLDINI